MMRWVGLAARYTGWQGCALALQVIAGFVVVRSLGVEEYARFSIVLGVMTAAITVADGGICNTLNARAAAAKGEALASWVAAARRLALARAPWVIAGAMVATWLLLRDEHAAPWFTAFAAAVVGTYIGASLARMLWHVAARLRCSAEQVLAVDVAADGGRAVLVMALVWVWPSAAVALLVPVAFAFAHGFAYRRLTAPHLARVTVDPAQLSDLRITTRQVLPVAVFFALQGQIALWVVSAIGTTSDVAGLGALGRFAMVYALAGPFFGNVLSPRLAAIAERDHLRRRIGQVVAVAIGIGLAVTALSAILADPALALLGPAYEGLDSELVAVMGVAGIGFVAGAVNAVNVSRAWYPHFAVVIPATLGALGVVAMLFDVSTLFGAITLSGAGATALLVVHAATCARGMAQSGGPRPSKPD